MIVDDAESATRFALVQLTAWELEHGIPSWSDSVEAVEAVMVDSSEDVGGCGKDSWEKVHVVESSLVNILAVVDKPEVFAADTEW